ncbi:MAG: hypothetical protein QOI31_1069 [Solirubrobacterales bacterium]|jgi:hypothetical protein|nr:hypothetical protein [Solirubrobacterales bacterium]
MSTPTTRLGLTATADGDVEVEGVDTLVGGPENDPHSGSIQSVGPA